MTSTLAAMAVVLWISGCGQTGPTSEVKDGDKPGAASSGAARRAAEAEKALPRTVTLDPGTPIKVRTTSTISTKTHPAGTTFVGTLAEPLVAGNWVIAPKGAGVEGRVSNSDNGGRMKGVASIAVALTKIHTADNRELEITTGSVSRSARTTKKKDAMKVGIGSGIGAAIGAIAGGGKGAAIGAGVGAGAGTGVVLGTHGDAAVIPAESVLAFALREPVTLNR